MREPSTFSDSAGRSWRPRITIEKIRRVKAATGVDLAKNFLDVVTELSLDMVRVCDVMWALCVEDAAGRSPPVTAMQFGEGLAGDVISDAYEALIEALRDFTPGPRSRARVGMIIEKARVETDRLNDQADQIMNSALSGMPLTSSPASSGVTQVP